MIEITPVKNLDAAVSVPGSKYIANRLLIICALADGTSILKNVPENEDISNVINAIKQFGIKIEKNNGMSEIAKIHNKYSRFPSMIKNTSSKSEQSVFDTLTIKGTGGKLKAPKHEINAGDSGTLLRFIAGVAALAKGSTRINGSKRIRERPISDLLKSLSDLGAKCSSKNGHAPITIEGGSLKGGKTAIDGSVSSQFISSLLMISPFAKNDVEISVSGNLVSSEYVDLTISLMKEFGVKAERSGNKFKVRSNQKYRSKNFTIPADWVSANYFLAAAAIVPGKIRIDNLDFKSKQPESGFYRVLERMGCKIKLGGDSIEIIGNNKLKGIEADMSSMPDSAQTLAAAALFAGGTTRIKNIGNLKFKESDRLNDTANELRKLGAYAKVTANGMEITPGKLKPAEINPHNDHRMAMSFAIAGLRIPGIKIRNPECVNKSFPQFWEKLSEIAISKKQKNIVLIGYRGAGKTSIANELSRLTGMPVISTDEEIRKKAGMDLDQFINKSGWTEFRNAESEVVRQIGNNGMVIDCGGGVVENSDNIRLLKKNGIVFWLKAPVGVLTERIKDTRNRPSITGKRSFTDEISEMLERRTPLYGEAADFEIETANKNPKESAKIVLELTKNQMKTGICAVVTADNEKDTLNDIKKAASADLIELRLDFIKNIDNNKIKSLIKNSPKPIIVTCRPVKFGGLFKGTEKDRLELLNTAIDNHADFIDVEFQSEIANQIINNKLNSKIIISHHDFKETPSLKSLNSLYNRIKKLNPGLIKIITTANSINDNFRIFELLEGKTDLIAFCMGQKGEISRILAPKFGSKITYCSLDKGKESALGQITMEEMQNLYHAKLINKHTNVIGIIGEFAENSMSKYMHNPNFVKNEVNFVYVPFKAMKSELKDFMENFRKFSFKGAAVTIPHKEKIISLIDELDETAERIGAVNTLVNNNGKLIGYNTDYYGAVMALKEITSIKGRKILILGAGGAARAVVYGLKKEGAEITITNRTDEKAKKLANEFKVNFDKFRNISSLAKNNDIIINTTSAGMSPNENQSVLDEKELTKGKIVMDIVYKPINTKLIKLARKKGCKVVTGDRMLIYQAVRQFELWTGINPGFNQMEGELAKQIGKGE